MVCIAIFFAEKYLFVDDVDNCPETVYATIYENISVCGAKDLISSNQNLIIIYCQGGCKCSFKSVKINNAVWATKATGYYNSTNDFLIYDKSGSSKSINYCEGLIGHVYGNIYRLEGGYVSWALGCQND